MPADSLTSTGPSEREQIRELLAANIQQLHDRVETAWATELDPEAEQLQLSRLRTISQLARQFRLLARDEDIDEMEEEIALLEDLFGDQRGDR